jgi:Spy/CpxP family protein refolding chaperone
MENGKTRREAALLVIVVFVLGVLLGGVVDHLFGARVFGNPAGLTKRDLLITQLTSQLSLTSDQQKQVTSIVDDTRGQVRALFAPLEPQHEQIRQQGRERIRAILTPEQRPKFEEFLRQLDEQRKRDQPPQ